MFISLRSGGAVLLTVLVQACAAPADLQVSDATRTESLQDRVVRLISKNSGLALDVTGVSADPGALIQQWSYWGGLNQRWRLVPHANGYEVISMNSALCLEVQGASKEVGAPIQQWPCSGALNQRWHIEAADGTSYKLRNVNSNDLLDVEGISKDPGAHVHQWPDLNAANQMWFLQGVDDSGNPNGNDGPVPADKFGNGTLHPEKIGFYMVPDMEDPYRALGGPRAGSDCAWGVTQASLIKFHQLMPHAVVRWDNETGHATDSPANVETMVQCYQRAGVSLIITASAVDGYNNWWANGGRTPDFSLLDFAQGPYVQHAADLMRRYSVIKLVETANEPDGPWFNSDGDNVDHFSHYFDRVHAAVGDNRRIVGPSAAFRSSGIWNWWASRTDLVNVSYHTYDGANGLSDVPGHNVYVTEYGGFELNPGAVLSDLWRAERLGKLDGSIKVLHYQQITDNGGNRGALNSHAMENGHFALRDWFRALSLYQAVATTAGTHGYFDDAHPDFVAADNGAGAFAALVWNNDAGSMEGQRAVLGTSLTGSTPLFVVVLSAGDNHVAQCSPATAQNTLTASVAGNMVTLNIRNLDAKAAAYISTRPCTYLAN